MTAIYASTTISVANRGWILALDQSMKDYSKIYIRKCSYESVVYEYGIGFGQNCGSELKSKMASKMAAKNEKIHTVSINA